MGAAKVLLEIILATAIANNFDSNESKNERQIKGKVVAITGAAQGIGYAIADNFLKNGAKLVIILDINVQKGKQAEEELNYKYGKNKTEFIECDVTKDVEKVSKIIIEKYDYIDIFINDAGIEGQNNKPRKVMMTNAVGTIEFSLKFLEYMRKDKNGKGGTIMNIASDTAHHIDPFFVVYRASKMAVLGFSRSLGQEYNYNKTGVRILTVCPGLTNTTIGLSVYTLFSPEDKAELNKLYDTSIIQSPDNVGKGTVDIFKKAKSGTSWDIVAGKPPFESSNTIIVVKKRQENVYLDAV